MGYYTYISGELELSEPLNDEQIAVMNARVRDGYPHPRPRLDGELIRSLLEYRPADGELTAPCDSVKAYDIEVDVVATLRLLKSWGITAKGTLWGDGEEPDDFWKIEVLPSGEVYWINGEVIYRDDKRVRIDDLADEWQTADH